MDHLAEALGNARGFASRRTSTSTRERARSTSPKPDTSLCSFCKSEAAAISVESSISMTDVKRPDAASLSQKRSGATRSKKKKSNEKDMNS